VTSTILRTEFLLQFRKQREDSAILLASNRPHNKDQTKKDRKGKEQGKTRKQRKTEREKEQGKTKNKNKNKNKNNSKVKLLIQNLQSLDFACITIINQSVCQDVYLHLPPIKGQQCSGSRSVVEVVHKSIR
jgi:hypothetical protein